MLSRSNLQRSVIAAGKRQSSRPWVAIYELDSSLRWNDKELSIIEFAHLVARVVGFEGEISFDKSKPDGTPRKIMDSSKINGLGWKASIGLEEGLRLTYEWYLRALEKGEVRGIKA